MNEPHHSSAPERYHAQAAPSPWSPAHVAAIARQRNAQAPVIGKSDFRRISEAIDVWDAWPVQTADGMPAPFGAGQSLWMALAAPRFDDPDVRHRHARIHLLRHVAGSWHDLGPAMPDGFSPGSSEWSGSAVLAEDGRTITLFFTAAGRRGEATPSFEQRMFSVQATLTMQDGRFGLSDWRGLREAVVRDPDHYMASDAGTGQVGTIKAFRDPAYFRDPRDGREYLFFAGSSAKTESSFNGVIGAAVASPVESSEWQILPPLVDASEVNNELERPHVVAHRGRYYLFWSTQTHVFDPHGPQGPTGLYGMVADTVTGDWKPLNGTGLVFSNPDEAPRQAYSWLVLPDLSVVSFVDDWGRNRFDRGQRRFGATFAPVLHLRLNGDTAALAG